MSYDTKHPWTNFYTKFKWEMEKLGEAVMANNTIKSPFYISNHGQMIIIFSLCMLPPVHCCLWKGRSFPCLSSINMKVAKQYGKQVRSSKISCRMEQDSHVTRAPYHKMQGAASHDYAKQQHLVRQQWPSQQRLMLVVPTTHQAVKARCS